MTSFTRADEHRLTELKESLHITDAEVTELDLLQRRYDVFISDGLDKLRHLREMDTRSVGRTRLSSVYLSRAVITCVWLGLLMSLWELQNLSPTVETIGHAVELDKPFSPQHADFPLTLTEQGFFATHLMVNSVALLVWIMWGASRVRYGLKQGAMSIMALAFGVLFVVHATGIARYFSSIRLTFTSIVCLGSDLSQAVVGTVLCWYGPE